MSLMMCNVFMWAQVVWARRGEPETEETSPIRPPVPEMPWFECDDIKVHILPTVTVRNV